MKDDKELIGIDVTPAIPKVWRYKESVERFRNFAKDVREHGSAALVEARNAHHHLYVDSRKKVGRRWPTKTFKSYCDAIGFDHSTVVRWLQRYFPDYYEEFQQGRVADATIALKDGETSGISGLERRPPRGYIRPMDDYVLDRGRDPFMRPKRDPERPKIQRRLLFLSRKFLNYRQQVFFRLHFLNGKSPEEIAAYYSKERGGEPLTADGVYRSLKRIRWVITRAYGYLCSYRLHKKLGQVLDVTEQKVLVGWVELQGYTWRGAPKE